MISYAFCADDAYPMQKTIGTYRKKWNGGKESTGVYQNLNGEITTYEEKHQWFYWLMQE